MRLDALSLALTATVLLAALSPATAQEKKLAIALVPPETGCVCAEDWVSEREGDVKLRAGETSVTGYRHSNQRIVKTRRTILAVAGDRVTKLKVEYLEEKHRSRRDDRVKDEEEESGAWEGKTFVLEEKDGAIAVTGGDGKPVDEKTAKLVRESETRQGALGAGDHEPLRRFLAKTPLAMDEEVGLPAEVVRKLMLGDTTAEMKTEAATIMLSGTPVVGGVRCAELDLTISVVENGAQGVITRAFSGGVVVEIATGRIVRWYGTTNYASATEEKEQAVAFKTEDKGREKITRVFRWTKG